MTRMSAATQDQPECAGLGSATGVQRVARSPCPQRRESLGAGTSSTGMPRKLTLQHVCTTTDDHDPSTRGRVSSHASVDPGAELEGAVQDGSRSSLSGGCPSL
eukprot:2497002-Rhodomonas_salina.2